MKPIIQVVPEELKIRVALKKIEEHLREGEISFCDIDDMIRQAIPDRFSCDTVAGTIDDIMYEEHKLLKEWRKQA